MENLWPNNKHCVLSLSSCSVTLYAVRVAQQHQSHSWTVFLSWQTLVLQCNFFLIMGISVSPWQSTVKPLAETNGGPISYHFPSSVIGLCNEEIWSMISIKTSYKMGSSCCNILWDSKILNNSAVICINQAHCISFSEIQMTKYFKYKVKKLNFTSKICGFTLWVYKNCCKSEMTLDVNFWNFTKSITPFPVNNGIMYKTT